jgi:hypothetical protein
MNGYASMTSSSYGSLIYSTFSSLFDWDCLADSVEPGLSEFDLFYPDFDWD